MKGANEHVESQRQAVESALRMSKTEGMGGLVHVYGKKLYGPPAAGEYHCSASAPFDGSQAGPVVFHPPAVHVGWAGSLCCLHCGVHSLGETAGAT